MKGEFYMFIDISDCTGRPTLMALVSGSVAHSLEEREDEDVKRQAMKVRQNI